MPDIAEEVKSHWPWILGAIGIGGLGYLLLRHRGGVTLAPLAQPTSQTGSGGGDMTGTLGGQVQAPSWLQGPPGPPGPAGPQGPLAPAPATAMPVAIAYGGYAIPTTASIIGNTTSQGWSGLAPTGSPIYSYTADAVAQAPPSSYESSVPAGYVYVPGFGNLPTGSVIQGAADPAASFK